jgi:NhaP-type Na+/H+ or K+/H+ antiporter
MTTYNCRKMDMDLFDNLELSKLCAEACPKPELINFHEGCATGHTFHSVHYLFNEARSLLFGRQYIIFSISFYLIIGAICRMSFPKNVPYTVGLLMLSFIVAVVGHTTQMDPGCPMYAFRLAGGDGVVQREEWDAFVCAGCHPNSYCVQKGGTCGDGSAEAPNCAWTFEDLNKPIKAMPMGWEEEYDSHAKDVLTADQLWTPQCNLYKDMLMPLAEIDPHVLLVVFLPALLFESAFFGIEFGIFWTQLAQILLMAFPAMIVASLVTALLLWGVMLCFYPDWSFLSCWLAGVITSATDPVAVVALLKELGAAKTLGTLIEGESLMNDGSAVVLYVVVKNAIGYTSTVIAPEWMPSMLWLEILRILAQMLFLGVIFGVAVGFVLRHFLRFVYNDRLIEGSLLIAFSYITFWAAELVMGSSAVLAVVVFGLYMNLHKSAISPECLHFLHEFFELMCHMLNTIIFVIAGLQLGDAIVRSGAAHVAVSTERSVEGLWHIWVPLILIYPIVIIARGAAVLMFYPLLKRLGTKCTWQEAVVMWWGGLRGAVGLALALAVYHSAYDSGMWSDAQNSAGTILVCRDAPQMILMVTCSVVCTTVIINGITIAPLMKRLKLTELSEDRVYMLQAAWDEIAEKTEEHLEHLKDTDTLFSVGLLASKVDWGEVGKYQIHQTEPLETLTGDAEDRAAWLHVLNMEAESYHGQYESGILGSEAFHVLSNYISLMRAQARDSHLTGKALSDLYDEHHARLMKRDAHFLRPFGTRWQVVKVPTEGELKPELELQSAMLARLLPRKTEDGFAVLSNAQWRVIQADLHDSFAEDGAAGDSTFTLKDDGFEFHYIKIGDLYYKPTVHREGSGRWQDAAQAVIQYEVCLSYLWGYRTVQKIIRETAAKHATAGEQGAARAKTYATIVEQHQDNNLTAIAVMKDIERLFHTHVKRFKTLHMAGRTLREQRKMVKHLLHEGALADLDASNLEGQINFQLGLLYRKFKPLREAVVEVQAAVSVLQRGMSMKLNGKLNLQMGRGGSAGAVAPEDTQPKTKPEKTEPDARRKDELQSVIRTVQVGVGKETFGVGQGAGSSTD